MMDHVINVHVIDKIAHVVGDPLYVCGNSDYTVKFDFDSEWAGHETKTARFVKNNKEYIDVVFTGDQCAMPILENTPSVRIGVYAGNLCTTTAAVVNAQRSILCGSGAPADPHPDVYAQVMQKMDDIYDSLPSEEVLTEIRTNRESAEEAAKKAESAVENIPDDYSALASEVDQLADVVKNKADVVVDTMIGSVCTTNVSADAPLQRLALYGKTVLDGTPTPEVPISLVNAGAVGSINVRSVGKNLFRTGNVNASYDADGTFTIKNTTGGEIIAVNERFAGQLPKGRYTVSYHAGFGAMYLMRSADDYSTSVPIGGSFTFDYDGVSYLRFVTANIPANTIATYKIQLEVGTVSTEFEPYTSCGSLTISTPNGLPGIPVASDGNYTDENGQQWVCDEIDFGRGVYIQRCLLVKLIYASTKNGRAAYYAETGKKLHGNMNKCALCNATDNYQYAYSYDFTHYYVETAGNAWAFLPETFSGNVEILCAMAEPVETSIQAEELSAYRSLTSLYHNTTVYNDAGVGMRVDCAVDMRAHAGALLAEMGRGDMAQYTHMPRMMFTGAVGGMTKDNAVILKFTYLGAENYINNPSAAGKRESGIVHSGYAKVKWQGSSSLAFPKKNYTITLYSDAECTVKMPITLRETWGAQSKYCMKANFIDPSHCRNVIAAKLWAKCVLSRSAESPSYQASHTLPNAGAIDGYPILTFINDEYVGLYTMNIPKDEWMFGMKDGEGTNVVLCGENYVNATDFFAPSVVDGSDWDYEVSPADKSWVADSFNRIYTALTMSESSADAIAAKKAAIENCLDVHSVIDYDIFLQTVCATDNTGKNQLMCTVDGTHWFISAYDLDTAFGMHWSGAKYFSVNQSVTRNNLLLVIVRLYATEYNARKAELAAVLSAAAVCEMVDNFLIDVPQEAFDLEAKLWPDMCGANANAINQIKTFMMLRNV